MQHWLLKTEPETWSWADQMRKGVEPWSGVRNHQAKNNLIAMRRGDQAFFYHSGGAREIIGTVEIVREAYPDPSDASGKFVMVDVKTLRALARPVTLAEIKAEPRLQELLLVRHTRLSVLPVPYDSWRLICDMAERPK
jgi:predicted RNA-binding protein with PUA-like domain